MDITFRSKSEKPSSDTTEPQAKVNDSVVSSGSRDVAVPYSAYEQSNSRPYIADLFELGDRWEEGFSDEIGAIEKYFHTKVENGDMADTTSSIDKEIKEIEKINNIKGEERTAIRLGIISAYVKFLMESEGVRYSVRKYGTN